MFQDEGRHVIASIHHSPRPILPLTATLPTGPNTSMRDLHSDVVPFRDLPDPTNLWDLQGKIGEGTYGTVYRAKQRDTGKWYWLEATDATWYCGVLELNWLMMNGRDYYTHQVFADFDVIAVIEIFFRWLDFHLMKWWPCQFDTCQRCWDMTCRGLMTPSKQVYHSTCWQPVLCFVSTLNKSTLLTLFLNVMCGNGSNVKRYLNIKEECNKRKYKLPFQWCSDWVNESDVMICSYDRKTSLTCLITGT